MTFTTWGRIEPRLSDPSLRPGVRAEVADPLWLLGRQWQLGEFRGEDAGSPAYLEVHGASAPLAALRRGDASAPWEPYDPAGAPLEAIVEAEAPPGVDAGAALAAAAGLRLVRELRDRGVAAGTIVAVRDAYPLAIPAEGLATASARRLRLAARGAPDGLAAAAALQGSMGAGPARGAALPPALAGVRTSAALVDGCHAFLDWVETVADPGGRGRGAPPPGWDPAHLEQAFAVAAATAGKPVALRAPRHRGGHLDWWALRASGEAAPAPGDLPTPTPLRVDMLAGPLGFPGAPAARYWEVEDGTVDLSAATASAHETAGLVVLEYAFVYGGDMLLVPVEVTAGSRTDIRAAVVVDVFGDRTLSDPSAVADAAVGRHRFAVFGPTGDEHALVLVPTLTHGHAGAPVEEVALLRDELANLGWAVESIAADAAGAPVDWRTLLPPPDPSRPPDLPAAAADARPAWRWRLMRPAPAHWHPLMPEAVADRLSHFVVGRVLRGDGTLDAPSRGLLLAELAAHHLAEEELPREGRRLTRAVQAARGPDGGLHLWTARRTAPGRGEGHSGVRFDEVLPEDRAGGSAAPEE
ncbi:MAG: hypothetical protein RIB67_03600 [Miltoncostaeaceae bacterium]